MLGGALWANASAQTSTDASASIDQQERGAHLYAWNCAVCHGATGGGIEEARLAFPPDHRRCTRCHKPNNVVVMSLEEIENDHDLFALGSPPPLTGPDTMPAQASAQALFAYTAATMPRYEPGRLTDEAYADLTAWMLRRAGRLDVGRRIVLMDGTVDVR